MNLFTSSLSSLQQAMCNGVRPGSFLPNAKSLMSGWAPAFNRSSVIATASDGTATAMCNGLIPSSYSNTIEDNLRYLRNANLIICFFLFLKFTRFWWFKIRTLHTTFSYSRQPRWLRFNQQGTEPALHTCIPAQTTTDNIKSFLIDGGLMVANLIALFYSHDKTAVDTW